MTYISQEKHATKILGRAAFATAGFAILGLMTVAGATAQEANVDPVTAPITQNAAPVNFVVKSASTSLISSGARAFKKGDHDLAVVYNMSALKSGLSKSRKAIAYSNLAAAYGARGEYNEAIEASNAALKLRPDLWEALQNRGAAKLAAGNLQAGNVDVAAAMAAKG